ncbi:MAG: universal stress protein [Actinobacteria bacterium]|nr:universal stress protein [Actinomycetota bacterium]
MKELVVGVDGSKESRAALRWAASVAESAGVPLRVVASWTHPDSAAFPGGAPLAPAEQMDRRTADEITRYVQEELGVVPSFGAIEALRGPAAAAIVRRVTLESTLVLGSVSRECIEYAPCPVVIVRQEQPLGEGHGPILVGKDGSLNAERALEWALALHNAVGGELGAVYVWQPNVSEVRPRLYERLRSGARAKVESWVEDEDHVHALAVEGDPRAELVDVATKTTASVLVVGRRGGGRLRGLRIGGVTNYLVTNSPTTVAVIPPPNHQDGA